MTRSRVLLVLVAVVAVEIVALGISTLGFRNIGYDFEAYVRAAERVLDGQPLYDVTVNVAGGFAIYLYPPLFALGAIPFAIVPHEIGLWQWTALALGSLVAAIAIMPVRPSVRWLLLALCIVNWPVLYGVMLGQVGPIMLLLFAAGWRWRDRPIALGLSIATGALIKVQPVILLAWAGATGRWRAVAVSIAMLAGAAVASTIVFGPGVWGDYLALLGRVNSSVTTPNGFSPGAIAYQAGIPEATARAIQLVATAGVVAVVAVSILKSSAEVSYLTTVVASQIVSPLVWDHYAIVLVLPVAWLLEQRRWWAVGIMLVTSLPVVLALPGAIYPFLFGVGLIAPVLVDAADRRRAAPAQPTQAVGSA